MSRSGYSDDLEQWSLIRWRGQVKSAIRGKRGQKFFLDLLAALDAMPEKRLIANSLGTAGGEVCALGALGPAKGANLAEIDTYDYDGLGELFGIAPQLAQEVMNENDECYASSPEQRWQRMREWALGNLKAIPNAKEGQ
jgi:hypothetical protein